MYRLCLLASYMYFLLESNLRYMYLINHDYFVYILSTTILYPMIPSRYMYIIHVNERYLVQYIYLFTGINCCKISQVAFFGLFYHFMHMYMLMYFKLQTIFIHICTCILNFRPYWITCGPASFTCLLSSVVQRHGKNYW